MPDNAVNGAYRRIFQKVGQQVTFRRLTGYAPNPVTSIDVTVNAVIAGDQDDSEAAAQTGYGARKPGAITQNARKIIVMTKDLADAGFPVPVKKGDFVVVQGDLLNVTAVDLNKRIYAGAVEVTAAGE